jgi:hypothetical protein
LDPLHNVGLLVTWVFTHISRGLPLPAQTAC